MAAAAPKPSDRAAILAQRRRIVAASQARHKPPKVPPADHPSGLIARYVSRLHGIARALHEATVDALSAEGVRTDAQGDAPPPLTSAQASAVVARVKAAAKRILGNPQLVQQVADLGAAVSGFSCAQFKRQVKAALGIDLTADPDLRAAMTAFRDENVSLIKSLTSDHVSRVRSVLTEVGSGTRVEDIMRRIREETGAVKSRAALIARDQVLQFSAKVTRKRHEAAGIVEFVWRTSRDERVRPEHRELDGKRFRYDDPPIADPRSGRRGIPGEVWQCRCAAEPILPGLDD